MTFTISGGTVLSAIYCDDMERSEGVEGRCVPRVRDQSVRVVKDNVEARRHHKVHGGYRKPDLAFKTINPLFV
ncbi:hypothetical protein J6590_052487 [Homalodisca vitripennis]|nr:hypothetical protein J6590_052487 [Homalodisca vitripennis]